jgi:hypothetical protein
MRDTHGEDLDLTESERGVLTAAWARLQEAGQDGWELVSASESKDRDTLDEERRYILKRPIEAWSPPRTASAAPISGHPPVLVLEGHADGPGPPLGTDQ